ncbi:MAG: hypothetical protein NPIRA04_08860 [Nitrospirales bacterium]|nr:MAG: hypothetical protein NPIRA04_08860 [Nitrospirales bacterium]
MPIPSDISFTDSLQSSKRQLFYEHHTRIAILMIVIVFILPLAGVFMRGLPGAVWGVGLSVFAYYLTPYTVLKLR